MSTNIIDILSAFMVLFAVIDIMGSIPIIISLKNKGLMVESAKATIVAFSLMFLFLFLGESVLSIFGIDVSSFAIAGSLVLFLMALEMVLGVEIFKNDNLHGASIVPIAFPLIAGAGSITTVLSLKAEFSNLTISIALLVNMGLVYSVLKSTHFFEKILGESGIHILKKFFGIILLAISIRLFLNNTGIELPK
ncbi:MAG: MarC family protein [Bacteroidales bacterium]|nr:MarC family protein [Bacteroidales bacterium]